MAELRYTVGDATLPQGDGMKYIIHCCNDIGKWGAGFVMAVSARWAKPEACYRDWSTGKSTSLYAPFELGQVQPVGVERDVTVINMIGQQGTRDPEKPDDPAPIRYDAIAQALKKVWWLAAKDGEYMQESNYSVHCPRFGAGLAGGDWTKIEQLLQLILVNNKLDVTVYDFEPT